MSSTRDAAADTIAAALVVLIFTLPIVMVAAWTTCMSVPATIRAYALRLYVLSPHMRLMIKYTTLATGTAAHAVQCALVDATIAVQCIAVGCALANLSGEIGVDAPTNIAATATMLHVCIVTLETPTPTPTPTSRCRIRCAENMRIVVALVKLVTYVACKIEVDIGLDANTVIRTIMHVTTAMLVAIVTMYKCEREGNARLLANQNNGVHSHTHDDGTTRHDTARRRCRNAGIVKLYVKVALPRSKHIHAYSIEFGIQRRACVCVCVCVYMSPLSQ
jgi:hypothetical protein